MEQRKWHLLQLFAVSADTADAPSGETAAAAGQQRLLELGVPADKIRKNRAYTSPAAPAQQPQAQQAAAADTPTQAPAKKTWEEIMADPEYNRQMQSVVQSRLKSAKAAEETLETLAPALEKLARQYGLDAGDYPALARAIGENREEAAPETENKPGSQPLPPASRELQQYARHIAQLEQQGAALRKTFPGFDLRRELQNPVFVRLTAPGSGLTVEDAYFAVHRAEIQSAAMEATAQATARKISNSIQAGSYRPRENGGAAQAASVTTFDYRAATPEQRAALKRQIREAAARGEKVYPGR